jgi:alkylhydroperoxidase family enzyme
VIDDFRSAPIGEQLKKTLAFLEKLTLEPNDIGSEDVKPLRDAGITDGAIVDAIYVCALFNLIDRVADSLDFAIPDAKGFDVGARMLLRRGYG